MTAPLRFYFDFISPYAYLGFHAIYPLAAGHQRQVELVPILFARLLDANATRGPAEIPAKRAYVFKDAFRTAHALGLPFGPPPAHPFNPLLALRIAGLPELGDARRAVVELLFREVWGGQPRGVTDPLVVVGILDAAGFSGAAWVEAANGDAAKQRVRDNTETALAKGVFGVPSVEADGEVFWGVDSFGHIERRLQGRDPLDAAQFERWRSLPAAAVRRAVSSDGGR